MGVEVDKLGRPVGYWFWDAKWSAGMQLMRERYFVPANEIIHLYYCDRVNQTRGVTMEHASMGPAHMLNAYEESEAIASRIAAAKMGFIARKGDAFAGAGGTGGKKLKMEASPGTLERLDEGEEFMSWDPQHPTGQFSAFVKQLLRKIASGLNVFYNVLANDAEQVTYSTMRSFSLIERDDWRTLQQDFIEMWRQPLYEAWLAMALTTGALGLPTRNPARYMAVRHRPRGWAWIDPEKETKAAVLAIHAGLGSRTSFLAERGEDLEQLLQELEHEKKLALKYGIDIDGVPGDDEKMTKEEWEALQEQGDGAGGGNGDGRGKPSPAETSSRRPSSPSRPRGDVFTA